MFKKRKQLTFFTILSEAIGVVQGAFKARCWAHIHPTPTTRPLRTHFSGRARLRPGAVAWSGCFRHTERLACPHPSCAVSPTRSDRTSHRTSDRTSRAAGSRTGRADAEPAGADAGLGFIASAQLLDAAFADRRVLSHVLDRALDGTEGELTNAKWADSGKCSADTALSVINDLLTRGVLGRLEGGVRGTSCMPNRPQSPV